MNILFHHRTRGRGAEGVHISGVVKGLRQLGHEVCILSLPGAEPEVENERLEKPGSSPDVQLSKDETKPAGNGVFKFITGLTKYLPEFIFEVLELAYNLVAVYRLRKLVKVNNIGLIYERYSLFMFASVWWCRRHGIPIVLEINDSCQVQRVRSLSFAKLASRIECWTFQNATGLVFISSRFKEIAESSYTVIAPSVISPNAADLDKFVIDKESGEVLKQKMGLEGKVILGYVGAFVHWHGIDWFIDEIVERLAEYPDLVLLLVGDGVSYEPIKDRVIKAGVASQVIMPGRVQHTEVSAYLSAMDFGILPDSNEYGSPMKLFEFMAMGKGMVAPDFVPIAEVVKDNETSWLFPANDRQACIEKVLALVSDKEAQQQVGRNARAYIERERQWKHNAEQLMSLVPNA